MVSKIKQTLLAISIAVVLAFFLGYAVDYFYNGPERDDFCKGIDLEIKVDHCNNSGIPKPFTKDNSYFCNCRDSDPQDKDSEKVCYAENPEYRRCWEQYDKLRDDYERNTFVILVILGMAAMFVGGVLMHLESVSSGIMAGGVLTLIYSVLRYWSRSPEFLKLVILGSALVTLIWIGYKKLNPADTKKSKTKKRH